MYQIRVYSKFSAAHNLRNYNGKCENLHGHTWKVEVCLQDQKLNEDGFLCDFKVIKKNLNEVLDTFDHSYINEVKPFDKTNPTAENLAFYIFNQMKDNFPNLKEVVVWESEDARAIYSE
jgi:6-pyruvoyltetrahydropterin/6-carboxytetrahydropterin synthase